MTRMYQCRLTRYEFKKPFRLALYFVERRQDPVARGENKS